MAEIIQFSPRKDSSAGSYDRALSDQASQRAKQQADDRSDLIETARLGGPNNQR